MCPLKEANEEAGPLLISRSDRTWCWLAQRHAYRWNLRSVLFSSPKGGVLVYFSSQSHHIRVSLKKDTKRLMRTGKLQCQNQKIRFHIRTPKCAWFWRHSETVQERTGEGAGIKPWFALTALGSGGRLASASKAKMWAVQSGVKVWKSLGASRDRRKVMGGTLMDTEHSCFTHGHQQEAIDRPWWEWAQDRA